ncbi:MAG: S8 family serine peptidase [Acidimicrobiales bacterium]
MRRLAPLMISLALVMATLPGQAATIQLQGTFVHAADVADAVAALRAVGLAPEATFGEVAVAYARVPSGLVATLGRDARVTHLEADRPLAYFTAKPLVSTRTDVAVATLRDRTGQTIDGRGVGVAVIDSGADATHPDLSRAVVKNQKFVGGLPVEMANSDDGGGHGTHVTGIVAGNGGSSGGLYKGIAPGSSLYVSGAGAGLNILFATQAMTWVLQNHAKVTPRIRVVNNSWGSTGAYNPNGVIEKITTQLVQAGVVVVWAAGNDGGNGSSDSTGSQAKHPIPGSLSIANYDDAGTGTRNGNLDPSSSRGAKADPTTWPDVSAPGANIMATCRLAFPVCNAHLKPSRTYPNLYAELSGTSMAAPVVTGLVALMLQADPSLTPARIEEILEDTSTKFGSTPYELRDTTNPDNSSSFDRGHGLVEAVAMLRAAGAS